MSKFQITVIGVFILSIIIGVVMFATFNGNSNTGTQLPAITIWGTFPADKFNSYVSKINQTLSLPLSITYVEKNQSTFSQDFVSALARGIGPDGILIPADALLPQMDKITPIPFTALPQRTFMDSYINEAQIYLTQNGVYAIPFALDPMVMFWNKDAFASAGLATYPKYWDEYTALNKVLTVKDQNGNIRKSALAMGDFANVANAREILATLFFQAGNPITAVDVGGTISSTLRGSKIASPTSALEFFTQFVNPASVNYSWNRGLPNSKTAFLSGMLETYFGFASELSDIRAKNPNLNFDVALVPQLRTAGVRSAYARMYGLSIVKQSANQNAVYQTFAILANSTNLSMLSDMLYLPSVSTSLIAAGSNDPYVTIFNQAALIGKTWFDADQSKSYQVFGSMVNAITSGAKSVNDAIGDANDQYDVILRQAVN